jgi:hypothetical protein
VRKVGRKDRKVAEGVLGPHVEADAVLVRVGEGELQLGEQATTARNAEDHAPEFA